MTDKRLCSKLHQYSKKYADEMMNTLVMLGHNVKSYQCTVCGFWHVLFKEDNNK